MIKIYKDYKTEEILSRKIDDYAEYEGIVKAIVADVAARGDEALREYSLKFDGYGGEALEGTDGEFAAAEEGLSED